MSDSLAKGYPKVSVIVLVYKSEATIEQCARSLFSQTLKDLEYVFVNDGSSDKSMPLLRRLIEERPEKWLGIKIVQNDKNCGTATSRNKGLENATGEYVIFCDSDDWIEPEMYEEMYQKAVRENADMVGCDYFFHGRKRQKYVTQKFSGNKNQIVQRALKGDLHGSAWNKLVRRDLYLEHDIRFPDGMNMWEDVAVMIRLCYFSSHIGSVGKALYHYRYSHGTVTQGALEGRLRDQLRAVSIVDDFFRKNKSEKEFAEGLKWLKFRAKYCLLQAGLYERTRQWETLFPETNRLIWKYSGDAPHRLFLSHLNRVRWFWLAKTIKRVINSIKNVFEGGDGSH